MSNYQQKMFLKEYESLCRKHNVTIVSLCGIPIDGKCFQVIDVIDDEQVQRHIDYIKIDRPLTGTEKFNELKALVRDHLTQVRCSTTPEYEKQYWNSRTVLARKIQEYCAEEQEDI